MAWVFLTSNLEKYNKINWILYNFWHLINNSSDIKLFIFGLFYYQWPFKLATRNHICSSICSQQRVHWGQEKILKAFSDSCCEASCTLRGQDCELFPYSQGLSKLSCWILLEYTFPAELGICDGGIHLFLLFPLCLCYCLPNKDCIIPRNSVSTQLLQLCYMRMHLLSVNQKHTVFSMHIIEIVICVVKDMCAISPRTLVRSWRISINRCQMNSWLVLLPPKQR